MHSVVYEFLVLFYNEAVINMSDDLLYAIPKIVFRTPFLFQKYPNICSERDIIVRSFKSDFEGSAISPVFDAQIVVNFKQLFLAALPVAQIVIAQLFILKRSQILTKIQRQVLRVQYIETTTFQKQLVVSLAIVLMWAQTGIRHFDQQPITVIELKHILPWQIQPQQLQPC